MTDFVETLRFSNDEEIQAAFFATSAIDQESEAHNLLGHIISTVPPDQTATKFHDIFKHYDDSKTEVIREGIVGSLEAVAAQPEERPYLAIAAQGLLKTFRAGPIL